MNKCFCCFKHVDTDVHHLTVNKIPICRECYDKYYPDIPTMECHACHCFTSINHGIVDTLGFTCNICLQDEYYSQMDECLNDPLHKDIEIDDIFEPPKVKKGLADMISKHNIKRIFRSIYDSSLNLLSYNKNR